jgi:hypothetical protein
VERPTGDYTRAGPWGAYRRWQATFVIVVFQFLHALDHYAMVMNTETLDWPQTWILKCHMVADYFFQGPLLPHGIMLPLLQAAQLSGSAQLRTLGAAHPLVQAAATDAATEAAIKAAKSVAAEVAHHQKVKKGAASGAGTSGGAAAALTDSASSAQTTPPGTEVEQPKKPVNLCGIEGCSYEYNTYICKHVFTAKCTNRINGKVCGLPHARTGTRKWTCREAKAGLSVLDMCEMAKWQVSYVAFSGFHSSRDAVKAALG